MNTRTRLHQQLILAHRSHKDQYKHLQAELRSKRYSCFLPTSRLRLNFLVLTSPSASFTDITAGTEAKMKELQERVTTLESKLPFTARFVFESIFILTLLSRHSRAKKLF